MMRTRGTSPEPSLEHGHLNDSLSQVNETSWLLAEKLLITHSACPRPEKAIDGPTCWSDGQGGHFAIVEAPEDFAAETTPLPKDSPYITMVHEADNWSAVWRVGEAFIKGHFIDYPLVTREHVTLEWLKTKQPLEFDIPEALHHMEVGTRYFLIVTKVPGQRLNEAWLTMDEATRQYYVEKIAQICDGWTSWEGEAITGVDGHHLLERFLKIRGQDPADALSPKRLKANCATMGMDVSRLAFYHCDLGPTNLFVDPATRSLGIIDWELAGYVPHDWVRSKFELSAGLDLDHDYMRVPARVVWRRRVSRELEKMGYRNFMNEFTLFHNSYERYVTKTPRELSHGR